MSKTFAVLSILGASLTGWAQSAPVSGFTTNYVCSKVIDGNVNASAMFTITSGELTIMRRSAPGETYTDVAPRLANSRDPSAPNYEMLSPAPWWFSGMNPCDGNCLGHFLTAGPIRESSTSLEIRVEASGTYNEGRNSYRIRQALLLDKTTGQLNYLGQVGNGVLGPYQTRVALKMLCHAL